MYFIVNQEQADLICSKIKDPRKVAIFTLGGSSNITIGDQEVKAKKLHFLPDNDIINGVLAGDISKKKVFKAAKKALYKPTGENSMIGLSVTQLVFSMTPSRRKNAPIFLFLKDEKNPDRSKFLEKYLNELLGEYGLKPMNEIKVADKKGKKKAIKINKLFKGKKSKVKGRLEKLSSKKGNTLSEDGARLKALGKAYYEIELRESEILEATDGLNGSEVKDCLNALVNVFTAVNLKGLNMKTCKELSKKDRAAVEAYEALREILAGLDEPINLPKVKYGQKKKGKGKKRHPVGPKMNVKKFFKFFKKKKVNRAMVPLIYGHLATILLGVKIGSSDYNTQMKNVCTVYTDEFAKAFVKAANSWAKAQTAPAKA